MDDWRHLLPLEPASIRENCFAELMAGMESLAGVIEKRNETRYAMLLCYCLLMLFSYTICVF
jgi:hypothetical protein